MRKVAVVHANRTGETETVVRTIAGDARAVGGHADLFRAGELADPSVLGPYEVLAVGNPAQEARDVPEVGACLVRLAASGVQGKLAAEPLRTPQAVRDSELGVCRAFGRKRVFAA